MSDKKIVVIAVVVCTLFVAGLLTLNFLKENTPQEIHLSCASQDTQPTMNVGGNYFTVEPFYASSTSHATTTKQYLTSGGASSTISFDCDGASMIDMNLLVVSSSTSAVYNWTYEFSYDNIDWFFEDGTTVASISAVTHSPSIVTHSWTPSAITSTKNITVTPVASKYCRISIGATGDNGSFWTGLLLKKSY